MTWRMASGCVVRHGEWQVAVWPDTAHLPVVEVRRGERVPERVGPRGRVSQQQQQIVVVGLAEERNEDVRQDNTRMKHRVRARAGKRRGGEDRSEVVAAVVGLEESRKRWIFLPVRSVGIQETLLLPLPGPCLCVL